MYPSSEVTSISKLTFDYLAAARYIEEGYVSHYLNGPYVFSAGAADKTDTNYDDKNGIRSIRVSPDGQHLASGDRQGNVR